MQFHAIDEVLKSPDKLPGTTEPISDKKLGLGDGSLNPCKLILGWLINALKKTLEFPLRRQQRILSPLAEFLSLKRCTLLSWQLAVAVAPRTIDGPVPTLEVPFASEVPLARDINPN